MRGLSKDVYSFKYRNWDNLLRLKDEPIDGLRIYVANSGTAYVTIGDLRFSYHVIPPNVVNVFSAWTENRAQDWHGVRLQRVAPMVLRWGRIQFGLEGFG